MTLNLCTRTSLPLLFPCHHLFRKLILLEDLLPPFPPSWDKGFLPLCHLLNVTHLTMSGTSLEEDNHHFGERMSCLSPFPFQCWREEAVQPSVLQPRRQRQKYSDVSNCVACSVCAVTAQAYWNLISYPCKQTFHVVPNINSPHRVGSAASSQLCWTDVYRVTQWTDLS